MTNKPQRRGRSYRNESKGPGIGLENIRWSAVIVTGLLIVVLLFAAVFGIRACAARAGREEPVVAAPADTPAQAGSDDPLQVTEQATPAPDAQQG